MPKKYKHIKLPTELIGRENPYSANTGRDIPQLGGINFGIQKTKLVNDISSVEKFFKRKSKSAFFPEDKTSTEVKIKFYGSASTDFLSRYRIEVYKKETDAQNNYIVYGKISNKPLAVNIKSDFERLKEEIGVYKETGQLVSYFQKIKEVKPVTFNQIVEKSLRDEFKKNPQKELTVDITFAKGRILDQKISSLKDQYADKFLSAVNSELVHFCRVKAKYEDIKTTTSKFEGIIDIEQGPIYELRTSNLEEQITGITITNPMDGVTPLFMFDGSVNVRHFTVDGAVVSRSSRDIYNFHGTAVASLLICGAEINPSANVLQRNKVIAINYFEDPDTAEELIKKTVEEFAQSHPILLINLSINKYYFYKRRRVDNLTILLDELAHKYECLFFISAGNLFSGPYWNKTITDLCNGLGYPNYFSLDCTKILPPADSINNISVGSITYQESINSIAKIKNPSPITRGNLKKSNSVKPDFVHFDSNVINGVTGFVNEGNGVYMAAENSRSLTRLCGTSFATPLVTHNAGILHNYYPKYKANTIKALLIHFSDSVDAQSISNYKIKKELTGFGIPNIDSAMHSLNSSACIVIEDYIGINKKKRIRFPIPACIAGDSRKRLRIRKTLVYNPKVNPQDPRNYNPLNIFAQLVREDDKEIGSSSSREGIDGAHKKSNVKKYKAEEISTKKHTGTFWYIDIESVSRGDYLPQDYRQSYSVVLSIEDMKQDDSINLYEEISNMIEIESNIQIPVEIISEN